MAAIPQRGKLVLLAKPRDRNAGLNLDDSYGRESRKRETHRKREETTRIREEIHHGATEDTEKRGGGCWRRRPFFAVAGCVCHWLRQ
jgi:hypothetical protein